MSDKTLQQLKRAWEASGSTEDEAAYLRERVRVGDLTQERLELAAYCGHEAAGTVSGRVWGRRGGIGASLVQWLKETLERYGPRFSVYSFAMALEEFLVREVSSDEVLKAVARHLLDSARRLCMNQASRRRKLLADFEGAQWVGSAIAELLEDWLAIAEDGFDQEPKAWEQQRAIYLQNASVLESALEEHGALGSTLLRVAQDLAAVALEQDDAAPHGLSMHTDPTA